MMKKYARKADYSDRGYNLNNIDGLLYSAVTADISSYDLAGV